MDAEIRPLEEGNGDRKLQEGGRHYLCFVLDL